MDDKQKRKLERYFRNARRFLWGLPRRNQKEAYKWLEGKGFNSEDGTRYAGPYSHVSGQLLNKYGIEKIIKELVIPRVKELFSEQALEFLRGCWNTGMLPDMSFLGTYNIQDPYPFLEINTQFKYVEGWGDFAGLWFEEIAPKG